MSKCNVCPHKCNVNRLKNKGRCKATSNVKIGLSSLHFFEEPCISGNEGSGTVFFSHCNLECVYCQNYKISQENFGKEITALHLAKIFLRQQEKGANNINLVSPTVHVKQIINAIKIAKSKGLNIPIIYNSNGYESIETIDMLDNYIDVYLPDFKYAYDELGNRYSKINNYTNVCKQAILKMYKQVGKVELDSRGIIKKGVVIRHLVLPGHIDNTKEILKWVKDTFNNDVYISIMFQYFPTYKAKNYKELNRKLTKYEYLNIRNYIYKLGFKNGYIQKLDDNEEQYVPNFDLSE